MPAYAGMRRVPGLRREEVAQAAGVSVDWYTRLERGKVNGVSAEVLTAIGRVLHLDDVELAHLFDLFRPTRSARAASTKRRSSAAQQLRPGLQRVLDSMTVPAIVNNERQDMVAANHLGRAIYPHAEESGKGPFNHSRFQFLDPRARTFYIDWELATRNNVALLRAAAGANPFDDELIKLVGQLSTQSERFRELWAAHDVIQYSSGTKRYRHPLVGDIIFDYESFELPTDPGLTMLVYTVEPGSPTEDALRILDSWASTTQAPVPTDEEAAPTS